MSPEADSVFCLVSHGNAESSSYNAAMSTAMEGISARYDGRTFEEGDYYECQNRQVYAAARNRIWLYTVDTVTINETGECIIQLVKWQAIGKKKSKTRIWRRKRPFNIRSLNQWYGAREVVDQQIDHLDIGNEELLSPHDHNPELISHSAEVSELRAEVGEKEALARHHIELSQKYKTRLNNLRQHIRQYRSVLRELENLINRKGTTETEVHEFLDKEKAYWVFGLEYVNLESKVWFPPDTEDFQFDLMLKRVDSFYDLVELKGPQERLFSPRTRRRSKLNSKLAEALMQAINYLDACARSSLKEILKPKALIVIGSRESDNTSQRRLLQSHLASIEILTYQDLVDRGKMLLEHIHKPRRLKETPSL